MSGTDLVPGLAGEERAKLTRIVELAGSVEKAGYLLGFAPQTVRDLLAGDRCLGDTRDEFLRKSPKILARVEAQREGLGRHEALHFDNYLARFGASTCAARFATRSERPTACDARASRVPRDHPRSERSEPCEPMNADSQSSSAATSATE